MDISTKFTVIFNGKFYVGVFERKEDNFHKEGKIFFSKNPSEIELYNYVLRNYHKLNFTNYFENEDYSFGKKVQLPKIQREFNSDLKKLRVLGG